MTVEDFYNSKMAAKPTALFECNYEIISPSNFGDS